MDAVKFINERNRMCKSFNGNCHDCPAFCSCGDKLCCFSFGQEFTVDAEAQIAVVEKWIAAHKTRQDVLLEQWPEAAIADDNGILTLCPATISSTHRNQYGGCGMRGTPCSDCCRDFWMQEVEQ